MLTFPIHRLSDWLTDCDLALQVAIALGLTPFEVVRRLATNADFDTSEDVLIWPPGTAYTLPTAAASRECLGLFRRHGNSRRPSNCIETTWLIPTGKVE